MGNLCAIRMNMGISMKARWHIIRMVSHLLHDVNLSISRPWPEVHGHHPESGPCTLASRQLDTSFDITVSPALAHLRIDTSRIDSAVLLQATDDECIILYLCNQVSFRCCVIDVILQFVIHPALAFHFVSPIVAVERGAARELIAPIQFIALGHISRRFMSGGKRIIRLRSQLQWGRKA